jgi:hypothetical protein
LQHRFPRPECPEDRITFQYTVLFPLKNKVRQKLGGVPLLAAIGSMQLCQIKASRFSHIFDCLYRRSNESGEFV